MKESERLLAAGIRAAQVKQHDKARELLMRVLELDEENEEAWLWLSGSVHDVEDKRICLENVLALNPNNVVAPLRLAELQDRSRAYAKGERAQLRNEPLNGALNSPYHPYAVAKNMRHDDVWSRDEPICAFCATPVKASQRRCSHCWRKLNVKVPTYKQPSRYFEWLVIYLVLAAIIVTALIVSVGSVALFADLAPLVGTDLQQQLVVFALVPLPLIILTAGIYYRQAWAYWLLLLILTVQIVAILALAMASLELFISTFAVLSPIYILYGWLIYIAIRAWPDFERRRLRRIANVAPSMKGPYELDKAAQQLARKGQWASAILHWRRAVGNTGGNGFYQWRLAKGYARLGFYRRAVDELEDAIVRLATEPRQQKKARRDLKRFKRKVK